MSLGILSWLNLRKKINTTNEWEKFYIEYLKSLSESKLKEIENLINGKL